MINFEHAGILLHSSGVYSIYNKTTGKQYIGSTTMRFQKRFWHHINQLRKNKHKNSYLQHAWNRYGEDDFEFKILEICSKENCLKKEQEYLDTYNLLYNINPLASGTPNLSKETIIKRNIAIKKHWKTHKKASQPAWNKGIPWSEEMRTKLKNAAKGRKQTEEGRIKRLEKSILRSKSILQYDLNMNFIKEWNNIKEIISNLDGYLPQGIWSCCNGSKKHGYYKNYIFKYASAPLNSNIQKELDEFGGGLSPNKDMIIPSQALTTVKEGVTTTGEV
jgi:group I intron endonuclease